MAESRLRTASVHCPCCGYITLHERAEYELCPLCWWEDDGQDDPHAEEVRGGPNGNLSLAAARRNFRDHMTMYEIGADTRVGSADSPAEVRAKRALIAAFDRLRLAPPLQEAERLWRTVEECESALTAELQRKIADFERRSENDRSV